MNIQGTSDMLVQNGIMPYDAHAYLFGHNNPNMAYIPQNYSYSPDMYARQNVSSSKPPKKHIFAKILVAAGVIGGAVYAIKKPEKARAAYEFVAGHIKKGYEFVRDKVVEFWNKIFKKGS